MDVNNKSGRLSVAEFFESPNHDLRPADEVSLLVIHGISLPPGQFHGDDIKDFFLNQLDEEKHSFYRKISDLMVSSHLVIRREGQIWQFVPFHKRAWHAGVSKFQEREKCNDFSVGIELEGMDTIPYTQHQYHALIECTLALMKAYPKITLDRIVGHEHIAPGRKTDPGPAFDWQYYRSELQKALTN